MDIFAFVAFLVSVPALAVAIAGLGSLAERVHALEDTLREDRPATPRSD